MKKRFKRIEIRLTDDEYSELLRLKTKPRLAEWIRETLLGNGKTNPKSVAKKVDDRLIYELNRVGNNLNQIAFGINAANKGNEKIELVRVNLELQKINTAIEEILERFA